MKKNILTALSIFLVSAIVYIATAPRFITTGDAGEVATAIYVWGIAHPTGFPLYIILAKLFSYLLPFFEFTFRLHIFSALCSAGIVATVFFICCKLGIGKWPAIASSLSLVFGYAFWTHAGTANVYSFTALMFSLAILIFLYFFETKKIAYLFLLSVICGIGAGAHLTFLLVIPFIIIYWLFTKKSFRPQIKISVLFSCFFAFLFLCLLVYSYIPLRAAHGPALNWGDPSTREGLISYITQREWSGKIGTRGFESWQIMLGEVGRIFSREFTWLGLIVVLVGVVIAVKKNKPFFYAGLSVIFFNILLMGNYGNNQDTIILWRYFLPSFVVMAVFIGYFFSVIPAACPAKFGKRSWKAGISSLILPAIVFSSHFGELNRRDNVIVRETIKNIFIATPENSVLITGGDTVFGALLYEQIVLSKRKDIVAISDKMYMRTWYREAKKKELEEKGFKFSDDLSGLLRDNVGKPLYSVSNAVPSLKPNFAFYPEGIVYKIVAKEEPISTKELKEKNDEIWKKYELSFLENKKFDNVYMDRELIIFYLTALNNLGAHLTNHNYVEDGIKYFEKSLSIRENKNPLTNLVGIYGALGDGAKAAEYEKRLDALK